jgi:hypothetical protein
MVSHLGETTSPKRRCVICSKQMSKQDSSNADFEIQNFLAWKKQGKRLNLVGKLSYGTGPSLRRLASGITHDLVNGCHAPFHWFRNCRADLAQASYTSIYCSWYRTLNASAFCSPAMNEVIHSSKSHDCPCIYSAM